MKERYLRDLLDIVAVIAAIAIVIAIGAGFRDASLKATDQDIAVQVTESVSRTPEYTVVELVVTLPEEFPAVPAN